MRSRLILAGATGLLFVLSTTALFVVNARTGPVDANPPQPGTYRYRSEGVQTRTSPSTTTERVDRNYTLHYEPIASTPDETKLRRRSENTASFQDKAWRADGIYDLSETSVGQGGTRTCTWKPVRLVIPLPLREGTTWKSDAQCDLVGGAGATVRQHETETGKVTGRRQATIAGREVMVFVIETMTTTIDTLEATSPPTVIARKSKATFQFGPEVGVVVRSDRKEHVLTRSPGTTDLEFWFETTDELLSLTPA